MGSYSKFIDEKRRPVPTPKQLVDADGKCVFGTFQSEFESMDLVRAKKPTHAPQFLNKKKLTLWEATEVHLPDGVLLSVLCDMGMFGKTMNVFYQKSTNRVYCWDTNLPSKETQLAPNLLGGSIGYAKTPVGFVKYENDFGNGKCHLTGSHKGDAGTIEYDFELTRQSLPSVVSIPFGPNRPLYSQKDLFSVKGSLTLNGQKMEADELSAAVVDDHRGYYPRRAHYDWVTTLGKATIGGKPQFFGFNLTHNQSIDQEKYNENLIWFEGRTSVLPPVTFTRNPSSKDFKDHSAWTVRDEHDMVNLTFHVTAMNPMIMHAVVVNIDYYIAYGTLEGYLRDEDGNKIILDGMMGMGEDKTLLL
jgi:hypothetical protein